MGCKMNVPKILNIKRLKAKKTADRIRANWERPVDYVKYKAPKLRDPVFHRTVWSWVKRKMFNPVAGYVDSKVNMAIEIGIKSLLAKFGLIIVVIVIGIIILIGC